MQSEEQFISRQVRRAEERKLEKTMRGNRQKRLQQARKTDLNGRQTKRELNQASDRGSMSTPVANLVGRKRICYGWFSSGRFR